jgi:tetratricopeptide (TPR) repeat protein
VDDKLYRVLKYVAVVMVVAWLGFTVYDSFFREYSPGEHAYHAGSKHFEDGEYREALAQYDAALEQEPDAPYLLRARARTLMQLGRNEEALREYNRAIDLLPYFGGAYANRGILQDRMGNYEQAIADYEKALSLDEELGEGPHWLVRFLRNEPEKPPTIRDRAAYLKQELAKPPQERVLRVPEIDAAQRTYKK